MCRNIFILFFMGVGFFGDAWGAKGEEISDSLNTLVQSGGEPRDFNEYQPNESDLEIYPQLHRGFFKEYDFSEKLGERAKDGGACGPSSLGLSRQDAIISIKNALKLEKNSNALTDLKKALMYGLLQTISDHVMRLGPTEEGALRVIHRIISRPRHELFDYINGAPLATNALAQLLDSWPQGNNLSAADFDRNVRGSIAENLQTLLERVPEIRKIFFDNIDIWLNKYLERGAFFESPLVVAAGLAKGCGVWVLQFNNKIASLINGARPPAGSTCMAYVRRIGDHFVSLFPTSESKESWKNIQGNKKYSDNSTPVTISDERRIKNSIAEESLKIELFRKKLKKALNRRDELEKMLENLEKKKDGVEKKKNDGLSSKEKLILPNEKKPENSQAIPLMGENQPKNAASDSSMIPLMEFEPGSMIPLMEFDQ